MKPRIEFYLTTALEVSHYAPILRALLDMGTNATFVSPQVTPKTRLVGWDDADRTETLIMRMGLPFVKHANPDADVAITIQPSDFIPFYRKMKIRMQYGVGLVPPKVINESKGPPFDYYLVHGPFGQRTQFRYHALASPELPPERVKVIGYPRFDAWFNDRPPALPGYLRPILLWLPTWGSSSSIVRYRDAVFALAKDYDIWVKPHHGTVHWEPSKMNMLENGPTKIVDFTEEPEKTFAAASVVLADLVSGAFGEALFLEKPTLYLTNWKPKPLVRCAHIIPGCLEPSTLAHAVELAAGLTYGTDQREFVDSLFTSTRGADGKLAAETILACLQASGGTDRNPAPSA